MVAVGQNPWASGGEKRAAKIAEVLADQVPGLDAKAIAGLAEFAELCSSHPQEVADFLRPRRKAVAK